MTAKEKQINTIPLLEILTRYAAKHAVSFSGVESNAIVEAMYDYATEQTAKYRELVEAYQLRHHFIIKYDKDLAEAIESSERLRTLSAKILELKKELGI